MIPEKQVGFIHHLLRMDEYEQAHMEIDRLDLRLLDEKWQDSLIFLKGWTAYWQKELDTAIEYLLKSDTSDHFYEQSRFYAAICASNKGAYQQSDSILAGAVLQKPLHQELVIFQKAGNALLRNELKKYDSLKTGFSDHFYALQEPQTEMNALAGEIEAFKPRSKFLAAALSAIIPGLGKIYAGKTGEGVSAFLITGMLGGLTAENLVKDGVKDWKTILAGSIFTTYYIGNIWGSYFAVQMKREEFYGQIQQQLLINMHIPLRTVF
ncbi:MAG: hypothetical protein R6U19_00275 [Bacteroidales bacterium]